MRHKHTEWVKPLFSDERDVLNDLTQRLKFYVEKAIEIRQQVDKVLLETEAGEMKKSQISNFSCQNAYYGRTRLQ